MEGRAPARPRIFPKGTAQVRTFRRSPARERRESERTRSNRGAGPSPAPGVLAGIDLVASDGADLRGLRHVVFSGLNPLRVTPFILFLSAAAASVLVAFVLWLEERRKVRAVPRLVVTTGVVKELESLLVDRRATHVRSQTLVQVDFNVGGKSYCCRDLYYFAGNRHVGDVGKKFDFKPGQQVGVYYDPEDPRRSALIIDRPRYDSAVIAIIFGAVFVVIALITF